MLEITIVGKKEVIDNLKTKRVKLIAAIFQTMKEQSLLLVRHIQRDKLQGQVLHHRSGRLQSSIKQNVVQEKTGVLAKVYTNVEYAAIHEYGFKGQVNVKEHLRTITKVFKTELISPKKIMVKEHTRQVNLPERSFMRSALKDNTEQIQKAISLTVNKVFNS